MSKSEDAGARPVTGKKPRNGVPAGVPPSAGGSGIPPHPRRFARLHNGADNGGEDDLMVVCDAVLEGLQLVIIDRRITIHRVSQETKISKRIVKEMVRRRAVPRAMAEAVHDAIRTMYKDQGLQDPTPEFRVIAGDDLNGHTPPNGGSGSTKPAQWIKREKAPWPPKDD